MTLTVTNATQDVRGKIIWLTSEDKEFHVVETKKGYARGGHYHPFPSTHFIVSGKVLYRESDMKNWEKERTLSAGDVANAPANIVHLMIALEDTIFLEVFDPPYQATIFQPFRQIVEKSMGIL